MEVLSRRLLFLWQQSPFRHAWLTALLAVNLILVVVVIYAWLSQHRLQQALQALPTQAAPAVVAQPPEIPSTSDILQNWPMEDQADLISAEILAQADALGMVFERAEFQSLPVEHATLQVQRIKLPVKGEYLQVRQFLSRVLRTYPSLALSQFKLQRTDVMQTGIEAYVEFSLYTRKRGQS